MMNCPNCKIPLLISERQNVEIDYCPQCRGVWLDRGELDKILSQSSNGEDHDRRYRDDSHMRRGGHTPYKKKKENFLSELFDF